MSSKKLPKRNALSEEMRKARKRNAKELGSSKFLPTESLVQILTRQKIASLLEEAHKKEFHSGYIASIMKSSLKTLAILVQIDAVENFVTLFKCFNDSCLPITTNDSSFSQVATFYLEMDDSGRKKQHQKQRKVFETWDEDDVENFETYQWSFLPVEFSYKTFFQATHQEQPLPIRGADFQRSGGGNFSEVYEVKLPIAHGPDKSSGDVSNS